MLLVVHLIAGSTCECGASLTRHTHHCLCCCSFEPSNPHSPGWPCFPPPAVQWPTVCSPERFGRWSRSWWGRWPDQMPPLCPGGTGPLPDSALLDLQLQSWQLWQQKTKLSVNGGVYRFKADNIMDAIHCQFYTLQHTGSLSFIKCIFRP